MAHPRRGKHLWAAAAIMVGLPLFAQAQNDGEIKSAIAREQWLAASTAPITAAEIDRLVNGLLHKAGVEPLPRTTDEQFLRRVSLDLTGRLPVPADINDFVADRAPDKRARAIERLLESEEYARHWSVYWREVIAAKVTDQFGRVFASQFEVWMRKQLQENKSWAEITRAILTASGEVKFADREGTNGAAYLMVSRRGMDAAVERASETSRIFLGIQIQCAQCHDHPFDSWKRIQFHEFTAYFARLRDQLIRNESGQGFSGINLVSVRFGEHRMPGSDDPNKFTMVAPRFLDGSDPGRFLNDTRRRESLADSITAKDNPWFAAAYVNRIWGALMGQSFYQPVDDMGPEREAIMPDVLVRLAGAFRGSDYDMKGMFRVVMNSETYQRQTRLGRSKDEHLLFAGNSTARLSADSLWNVLQDLLGKIESRPAPGGRGFGGPFGRFGGLEVTFKDQFNFDPSSKSADVESSISQALILMNNPSINQKIRAEGANLLAGVLSFYGKDDDALKLVYQWTLARSPGQRELERCREHLRSTGNRTEAFEDILWALINSTEFQTRK